MFKTSEPRRCAEVPLVRAARHDLRELGDRMPHLVLGVEEVRAQADPSVVPGTEVADDAPLSQLAVTGGVIRRRDRHGAAATRWLPRRDDLEPRRVAEVDEELRERERALADPLDSD